MNYLNCKKMKLGANIPKTYLEVYSSDVEKIDKILRDDNGIDYNLFDYDVNEVPISSATVYDMIEELVDRQRRVGKYDFIMSKEDACLEVKKLVKKCFKKYLKNL